jgi:hypothetical protein
MAAMTTHGYMGDGSPDRVDALVWALTEIFPRVAASTTTDLSKRPVGSVGTWTTRQGKQVQLSYKDTSTSFWARQRNKPRGPQGPQGPHK